MASTHHQAVPINSGAYRMDIQKNLARSPVALSGSPNNHCTRAGALAAARVPAIRKPSRMPKRDVLSW